MNFCRSCKFGICGNHINLHEIKECKSIKKHRMRWSYAKVVEDLIAKISITYDCEKRILDQNHSVKAKCPCSQTLDHIKGMRQNYVKLLRDYQNIVNSKQLTEINREVKKMIYSSDCAQFRYNFT